MNITTNPIFFTTDDKSTFGMSLESDQTIDDMGSRLFQPPCHKYIIGFIKAGLYFHQNSDLFPILNSFFQRLDNRT